MGRNTQGFSEIYRELTELVGESATLKIWRQYSGTNISFPMRLYTADYMREFIAQQMSRMKPRDIARELGITERRVRQIQQEIRRRKTNGTETSQQQNKEGEQ